MKQGWSRRVLFSLFFLGTALFPDFTAQAQPATASVGEVLKNFPPKWTRLDKQGAQWVIVQPCDADTPNIVFSQSGSKWNLSIGYGQMAEEGEIIAAQTTANGAVFTYTWPEGPKKKLEMTYAADKKTAVWKGEDMYWKGGVTYVQDGFKASYPLRKEKGC